MSRTATSVATQPLKLSEALVAHGVENGAGVAGGPCSPVPSRGEPSSTGLGIVMRELSALELILLKLVNEGRGRFGWHTLATRLGAMNAPLRPDMMVTLKRLAAEGLVVRHVVPNSPHDRWELTDQGRTALAANPQEPYRTVEPPRPLGANEADVLGRLLSVSFPGRDELVRQAETVQVKAECACCPTIYFKVAESAPSAKVKQRIAVEAEVGDPLDERTIHVLLHVVGGLLSELEFYRNNGDPISRASDARVTSGGR